MLDRLDMLETSETFELFQICKRSGYQSQSLLKLLENCREQLGNLLSDLPLPQSTGFVSEFEMKKVEDSLAIKKHKTAASSDDQSSSDCTTSQLVYRSFHDTLQNSQKDDARQRPGTRLLGSHCDAPESGLKPQGRARYSPRPALPTAAATTKLPQPTISAATARLAGDILRYRYQLRCP